MPVFPILALAFLAAAFSSQAGAQEMDAAVKLYEHGKFQEAEELFSSLSRRAPNDADLQIWLGKARLKLRRRDDAVLAFRKAVAIEAKSMTCDQRTRSSPMST